MFGYPVPLKLEFQQNEALPKFFSTNMANWVKNERKLKRYVNSLILEFSEYFEDFAVFSFNSFYR